MEKFLIVIFLCFGFYYCSSQEQAPSIVEVVKDNKLTSPSYTKELSEEELDRYNQLFKRYIKQPVPYSEFESLGRPQTLPGTNNDEWHAYFPKADFTVVTDKSTDKIRHIRLGKHEF